jgi:hypothetical protein
MPLVLIVADGRFISQAWILTHRLPQLFSREKAGSLWGERLLPSTP